MAKILALITALESVEAHKALAAEARTQLAPLLELDAADVVGRLQKGDQAVTQVTELTKQVKDLDEKSKGSEALRATVQQYELRDRNTLIEKELGAAAKKFGVRADAVSTLLKVADLSSLKVDVAKGTVAGFTQEMFDGLKREYPLIIDANANNGTVTPPPPANGTAAPTLPKIEGAVGSFIAAIKS